jgi:hypothetical protein
VSGQSPSVTFGRRASTLCARGSTRTGAPSNTRRSGAPTMRSTIDRSSTWPPAPIHPAISGQPAAVMKRLQEARVVRDIPHRQINVRAVRSRHRCAGALMVEAGASAPARDARRRQARGSRTPAPARIPLPVDALGNASRHSLGVGVDQRETVLGRPEHDVFGRARDDVRPRAAVDRALARLCYRRATPSTGTRPKRLIALRPVQGTGSRSRTHPRSRSRVVRCRLSRFVRRMGQL